MADGSAPRLDLDLASENDRYHRQNLISWWDQEKLEAASVLVVGAGALGNELAKNLALMGVGRIVIADMDHIEYSNLARCVFFRPEDEGRNKATVLADRVSELNRDVEVVPLEGDIRLSAGLCLFDEVDVVLGGLDSREARLFVNRSCWKTGTPWVDGAIEGLMGTVRVFIPPDTACYECTLGERDFELMENRRSCALLSREEMEAGKVPTTATSAGVVAAIEVQEAIKLLHRERLGEPTLAGAGFHFSGLNHDSYVVGYSAREDCLSHDRYDLEGATKVGSEATLGDILALADRDLGGAAVLELEREMALAATCERCRREDWIGLPVDGLEAGIGVCGECEETMRLSFAHTAEAGSRLLESVPEAVGIPRGDVIVARRGMERAFFRLDADGPVIDSLRAR